MSSTPQPTSETRKDESLNEDAPSPSGLASDPLVAFDPEAFEKLLQAECKLWQRKLRLQDWNVQVRLVRLNEMPDQDAIGAISQAIERKDAQMTLLSPLDMPLMASYFMHSEEMNYSLTIVHELLHLHMAPFTAGATETELVAEEQAINAISQCIFNAYAKHHKGPVPPVVATTTGHYL